VLHEKKKGLREKGKNIRKGRFEGSVDTIGEPFVKKKGPACFVKTMCSFNI